MEYSMGLFVYYFGTKKIYNNVEHHTIKFGNKYKEHLDDIFNKKKLNNDISYYLHRPSATDKSMAPKGNDCFYVLVPVPNNQSGINPLAAGDWRKRSEDRVSKLINYKGPIDLITGRQDPVGESVVYEAKSIIPQLKYTFIEQCGHFPWIEGEKQIKTFYKLFDQSMNIK